MFLFPNNFHSYKQTDVPLDYFRYLSNVVNGLFKHPIYNTEAKGDWDFRISDLVKNPDGTDI